MKKSLEQMSETIPGQDKRKEEMSQEKESEKEKEFVIGLVEDAYIKQASGYFESSKTKDSQAELQSSVDLKKALSMVENLPAGKSGVVSDLFFPQETGSGDKSEGKKILAEICNFYRINDRVALELVTELEKKRIEYLNTVQELKQGLTDLLGRDIKTEEVDDSAKRTEIFWKELDSQGREKIKETGLIKKIKNLREGLVLDLPKGLLPNQFTDDQEFKRGFIDLIEALSHEDESLQPLGIRVVEKASELGIPVVIATSHHAIGQGFARLSARYLKERGILKHGGVFKDLEQNYDDPTALKQVAKESDIFLMFKSESDDKRTQRVPQTWRLIFDELRKRISNQ